MKTFRIAGVNIPEEAECTQNLVEFGCTAPSVAHEIINVLEALDLSPGDKLFMVDEDGYQMEFEHLAIVCGLWDNGDLISKRAMKTHGWVRIHLHEDNEMWIKKPFVLSLSRGHEHVPTAIFVPEEK